MQPAEFRLKSLMKTELDSSLQKCLDFKGAIDRSTLAVRIDSRGFINYVSDRFCEISLYSRTELLGCNWEILLWEDRANVSRIHLPSVIESEVRSLLNAPCGQLTAWKRKYRGNN